MEMETENKRLLVVRTLRNLPLSRRVDTMPLSRCLKRLGVPVRKNRPCRYAFKKYSMRAPDSYNITHGKLDEWEAYDLYREAKKIYIEGCKTIQTQFVENHELAASWNALWSRIEELFNRKLKL